MATDTDSAPSCKTLLVMRRLSSCILPLIDHFVISARIVLLHEHRQVGQSCTFFASSSALGFSSPPLLFVASSPAKRVFQRAQARQSLPKDNCFWSKTARSPIVLLRLLQTISSTSRKKRRFFKTRDRVL